VAPFTERARHKASQPGNKRKSLRCLRRHLIVCPSLSARVFPLSPLPPVPLQARRSRSVVLRDVESSGLPRKLHSSSQISRWEDYEAFWRRAGDGRLVFALWTCIVLSYPSRVVRKTVLIWPLTAKQFRVQALCVCDASKCDPRGRNIFFAYSIDGSCD